MDNDNDFGFDITGDDDFSISSYLSNSLSSEAIDYSSYFVEMNNALDKLNSSVYIIYILCAFILLVNFFRRK